MNIVWQSALPPTLCAICVSVLYIQYSTVPQVSVSISAPAQGSRSRELIGATSADDRLLDTITALDAGYPADDREALRSFVVLHDVRRASTSPVFWWFTHLFWCARLATLNRYNQTSNLRRSYRLSLCQRRYCIQSRGTPEGETLHAVRLLRDAGQQGPATLSCNRQSLFFKPLPPLPFSVHKTQTQDDWPTALTTFCIPYFAHTLYASLYYCT